MGCHLNCLEAFQQVVELQEAQMVFVNLGPATMNSSAYPGRQPPFLQELKGLLGTWRDRLPNPHDNLPVWSDLLVWRQHVYSALSNAFHLVNQQQQPVIDQQQSPSSTSQQQPQQNPLAFRGYNETAWLINRFARVCRKNGLLEVCLNTLNRIYTLPNIEIQDAFLKLREQTKCYMTEATDLPLALEVVNATNLNYFTAAQKAEFFTLKAVVYLRLGMLEEANRILAQAVQIDLNLPKGWAVWAGYNDLRFQQSNDRTFAINAINCYLQAASLHKSGKCRKYLSRVLWLGTFEDDQGSMLKQPFELYAGELPIWYWIFFIPQLLVALNRKEYRQARLLLVKIAKTHPQALYANLRAAIEDYRQMAAAASQPSQSGNGVAPEPTSGLGSPPLAASEVMSPSESSDSLNSAVPLQTTVRRGAVEEAEDVMAVLKTAYPLLTLSIENLIDHLVNRLRASPDEDLLRILTTLLTEASQQLALSVGTASSALDDSPFRAVVDSSLRRVSFMISSFPYLQAKYKEAFDAQFITDPSPPSLPDIVRRLREWRVRVEEVVNTSAPRTISIDTLSRYLSEFEHQRYDDVEVPGQYLTVQFSLCLSVY